MAAYWTAPSTAAPPHMSVNIIRMPSAGLMFKPPLSKVMPLPTSTTCCGLAAPRVRWAR